jgi:hypothetical protein
MATSHPPLSESRFRPRILQSVGIILSYQCTNVCRHCLYSCSPQASAWMSREVLMAIVDQLLQFRDHLRSIHLAGGEPFLRFEFLVEAVELLSKSHLPLAYVETNAYWATREDIVRAKLEALRRAGLRAILISVSPFHLEQIPFERTERAVRLAEEVFGRWNVLLFTPEFYEHFKSLGIRGVLAFEEYRKLVPTAWLARLIRVNYQFVPNGRGAFRLAELFPSFPARQFFSSNCREELSYPGHVHIDLYGNYIGGLCAGISVGNGLQLSKLYNEGTELEGRPFLRGLVLDDLETLFRWAQENFGYTESETGYIAKCHLCADLREHLYRQGFRPPELAPPEFYLHLRAEPRSRWKGSPVSQGS